MPRAFFALPLLFVLLSSGIQAQRASLPGCEPPPALRKALKDLDSKEFRRLPYQQREERKQRLYAESAAMYPREIAAYRRRIMEAQVLRSYGYADEIVVLQKRFHEQFDAHPDDPLAIDLYASALRGTDTPESIRLLDKAESLAPNFSWPSLELAQIYSSGKFADMQKFTDDLTKFWTACPTSQDGFARWMLVKLPKLQTQVAKAERAALEKSTDPDQLEDYDFLWSLDFRTTSPQKFPELRQQVAADLRPLEHANPHPDAAWAQLLINGSKQTGASPASITASEDSLIAKYPHSNEAFRITAARWDKAHPDPDAKDVAGWQRYRNEYKKAAEEWIRQYPERFTPIAYWRYLYLSPIDDSLTEQQGIAMTNAYLTASRVQDGPFGKEHSDAGVADFLLEHKWQPDRAIDLLTRAMQEQTRLSANYLSQDDHSESDMKEHVEEVQSSKRDYDASLLLAAMRAHRPDAITPAVKTAVEAPRATDDKDESAYWLRRARLAAIEGQQQDALGYYQLALRTRPKPPSYERGKLQDDLSDEAHTLWTRLGGTEVAWAAWSQSATSVDAAKADDARWEKPTKALPAFELADLSGKTWSVKSLNGKVVLINLWATWCGPCNAELPQLQKLYEQAKDRSDLQIITFNIDEDLGLVEPFMKEKGYTFPVVPAYSYVVNLLDGYAIPQNWVLNPKGDWQWTQVGYGSDDTWVKDMLAKLDAVKAGG
jgi:thiol-disulfide isomerase/thioredoxin